MIFVWQSVSPEGRKVVKNAAMNQQWMNTHLATLERQLMSYLALPVAPTLPAYTRRVRIVRERVQRLAALRRTGQESNALVDVTKAMHLACVQLAAAVTETERQVVLGQILRGDFSGTEVPS
jgi:hypothetical protein